MPGPRVPPPRRGFPRAASGFCVYNDPAIAITWLLTQGAERIGYVDLDVHHGDGVQAAFYADPRVLAISLHEHPRTLFPGTGLAAETGSGAGAGYPVNVPLPAGTGDAGWLRAFDAVVPPLLREFRPQVLVSQHGCDGHRLDPLAHLGLSVDAMRVACAAMHRLAHETAGAPAWASSTQRAATSATTSASACESSLSGPDRPAACTMRCRGRGGRRAGGRRRLPLRGAQRGRHCLGPAGVSVTEALIRLRAYAFSNDRLLADVADDVVARRLRLG